jgi:hypothetical protein
MALKDSNRAKRPRQCFLELLRRLPAQAIHHTMGDDTSTRPHELREESSRKFLEAYGILTRRKRSKAQHAKMLSELLRAKHPRRPVLHQSKMRHMPPTYDAYAEAKEKEQEKDSQLMTMQEQMALTMAYLMEKDPEKKADISREPIEITC